MKIKIMLLKSYSIIIILCLGKMISATGQTLFSVNHALHYVFKNNYMLFPISFFSLFAAICTLLIVLLTRVPAIYKQFYIHQKQNNFLYIDRVERRLIYYFLINANIIAGIFSSVGAYLGAITLIEFIAAYYGYSTNNLEGKIVSQVSAVIISIASFASFYSFNIQKAKANSVKLANINKKIILSGLNKNFLKTMLVSFLTITSLPFIAYFLTKNAIYKMPYVSICLSVSVIKSLAILSAFTALISSITTSVSAMHDYFNHIELNQLDSPLVEGARYVTYALGLIDSCSNGLGTFLGVVTVSHDFLNSSIYHGAVIFLAVGCALSSTILIFLFSIRQGFNDLINYARSDDVL